MDKKFPYWHQPDSNVGAVLVASQEEADALDGWPFPDVADEPEEPEAPARKKPGPKPKG